MSIYPTRFVTSNIVGKGCIKDPGLHRSIFADNFSTALSGLVGGVPTTTYGENIGVMAITGVYSIQVIAECDYCINHNGILDTYFDLYINYTW